MLTMCNEIILLYDIDMMKLIVLNGSSDDCIV